MKKRNTLNTLIGCTLTAAIFFAGTHLLQSHQANDEENSPRSQVPYNVTSPEVPTSMEFAGENIDLTRSDLRERMDREILTFTYSHINTQLMLKRANRLFPIIEPILKQQGVPDDFKYLMIIESNGDVYARSSVGAAGLWQIMPATGKQYTKTTVEHGSSEATYGIPLSFGAGIKLRFTDRWSLGIGVNYSLLTSRFNGKYIKVNEDGTEDLPVIDKISNRQHYIGIPLNVYYDIMKSKTVNFYAYAGGTVEKCIGNNYQVLTTPVIHHTEQPKGVQLSVNAGIGAEFMLGRHLGLYIDPSLRYYFNNGQPKSIRTAQPLMLGFEMGLRFNL